MGVGWVCRYNVVCLALIARPLDELQFVYGDSCKLTMPRCHNAHQESIGSRLIAWCRNKDYRSVGLLDDMRR